MSSKQFEAALTEYLQAVDSGDPPDRDAFLARYPTLTDEFKKYFAAQDEMDGIARPLRPGNVPKPTPRKRLGDYEILAELGRGGMGVVYKARQVSADRLVALKVILSGEFADPEEVLRFRREAEAAAQLDHPGIVPLYEVGEYKGRPFYSMKLVEGTSLAAGLSEESSGLLKTQKDAARRIAAVARAVHHAHQRGILHRDLKPANILLDAEGNPHVTDFGLAKRLPEAARRGATVTNTGAIVGTPEYMAPEQALARKDLTVAADVYALGAVLYALLTTRPPFQGGNVFETLEQVIGREPTPPRAHNPRVDRDLEVICLKCLEKDAARRYDSALDLAMDLERWQVGEPIMARPVSGVERAVKWVRRRPVLVGLSAAVVFSVVLGATLVAWQMYERTRADARARLHESQEERERTEKLRAQEAARLKEAEAKLHQEQEKRERAEKELALSQKKEAEQTAAKAVAQEQKERTEKIDAQTKKKAATAASHVAAGWRAADAGARTTPALHFVQALQADPDNPERTELYRTWIAGFLRNGAVPTRIYPLKEEAPEIQQLEFSPDGRRVLAVMKNGSARVWEAVSGKTVAELADEKVGPSGLRWMPDGGSLRGISPEGKAFLWGMSTGRVIPGHAISARKEAVAGNWIGPPIADRISPDGRRAAVLQINAKGGWNALLVDLETGATVSRNLLGTEGAPDGWVAWSPTGTRLLTCAGDELTIRDATGKALRTLKHTVADEAAPKPPAPRLPNGKPPVGGMQFPEIRPPVFLRAALSADGKYAATARSIPSAKLNGPGFDFTRTRGSLYEVCVWDLSAAKEKRLATVQGIRHAAMAWPGPAYPELTFSPEGRRLLVVDGITATLVDVQGAASSSPLRLQHSSVTWAGFTKNGGHVVTVADPKPWELLEAGERKYEVRVWHADSGAAATEPITTGGKSGAVALAPDEPKLLTVGVDGLASFWDLNNSPPARPQLVHPGLAGFCVSPDGTLAITWGTRSPHSVRLWETATGHLKTTLPSEHRVLSAAFTPDGTRILTLSGSEVLPGKGGEENPWKRKPAANGGAFPQPGTLPGAAGSDKTFARMRLQSGRLALPIILDSDAIETSLWDVSTGQRLTDKPIQHDAGASAPRLTPQELIEEMTRDRWGAAWPRFRSDERDPVLSPDGRKLLTVVGREFKVYDTATGRLAFAALSFQGELCWFGWSDDSSRVLATLRSGDWRAVGWNASTGKPAFAPVTTRGAPMPFFRPDGAALVICEENGTSLRLKDVNGRVLRNFPTAGKILNARFEVGGKFLIAESASSVKPDPKKGSTVIGVWDVATGKAMSPRPMSHPHESDPTAVGGVAEVSLTPDGRRLLTCTATAFYFTGGAVKSEYRFWDVPDGKVLLSWQDDRENREGAQPSLAAGGRWLVAVGGVKAPLRLLDPTTAQSPLPSFFNDGSTSVDNWALSADGKRLAAVGTRHHHRSGTVARVWDATTGEPLSPLHTLVESAPNRNQGFGGMGFDGVGGFGGFGGLGGFIDDGGPPPLKEPGELLADLLVTELPIQFSLDGRRVLVPCNGRVEVWNLTPDGRPVEHLAALAEVLSHNQLNAAGELLHLRGEEYVKRWKAYRERFADAVPR